MLWLNTALLVLSSVAMQWTRAAARRGRRDGVRDRPRRRGRRSTFCFLAGQLLGWQQLNAAGYFAAGNPANAFFYLLTALHGLHLLGGLCGLGQDHRQGVARRRRSARCA